MNRHTFFQITFAVAWLIDTIATAMFVTIGGVEMEANPIMHWFISTYGVIPFIYLKYTILFAWGCVQFSTKFKWWYNMILSIILVPVAIMGTILAVSLS